MGEKLVIRQVKQAGCVIGHDVDDARDAEDGAEAALEALVEGLETEQTGRCRRGCSRAFSLPGHCWGVVRTTRHGAFSHIVMVGCDIVLCDSRCKLEVGVRNLPRAIIEGHKVLDNIGFKARSPENRTFVLARCKRRATVGINMRLIGSAR